MQPPPQDPNPPGTRPHQPGPPPPGRPGAPPPKKKSKLPWLLGGLGGGCLLLVIGAVVAVLFATGVLYMPPPPHDPPPLSEQRVGMSGGEFTELSVSGEYEKLDVTVTAVGTGIEVIESTNSGKTHTPTGRFVAVYMTITNTHDDSHIAPPTMYELVDGDDNVYEVSDATTAAQVNNDVGANVGLFERGQTVSFINIYDVPTDAEPVRLVLRGTAIGDRDQVLDLTG